MVMVMFLNITGNGNYLGKYSGNFCWLPIAKSYEADEFNSFYIFPPNYLNLVLISKPVQNRMVTGLMGQVV